MRFKHVITAQILCDVAEGEASDRHRASISRVDRMDNGPPDQDQTRAQISGVITVQIEPWWEHLDRWIAIQGVESERFYNAY